jgi:hypothetical protein
MGTERVADNKSMISQQQLNFGIPRSRRDDPLSSKRAAEQIVKSGALKGQAEEVYRAMQRFPFRSSKQLAHLGKMDRTMVGRRVVDVWRSGHAVRLESPSREVAYVAIIENARVS